MNSQISPNVRNMDAVLRDLTNTGVTAVIENMGGGNLAIATGSYDTDREAFTGVLVGPAYLNPDGITVAHRDECYIGPDDSETEGDTVPPNTTHSELVNMIVAAHEHQKVQPCSVERGYCVCDLPAGHNNQHHCEDCGDSYEENNQQMGGEQQ